MIALSEVAEMAHFKGYPNLTAPYGALLEARRLKFKVLKSTFRPNADNFIRGLPWSVSSHFVSIHY